MIDYPGDDVARAAFDVMMRRGWTVSCLSLDDEPKNFWVVRMLAGFDMPLRFLTLSHGGRFPDPFTALVEARKWYRENVEPTATHDAT